ncbi:MAG TPA: hypothetical protein VGY32_01170 [Solirubrobacteraceae bacterium]|nr:hypothetical protein [Solirubrobacteraceae bacterium]
MSPRAMTAAGRSTARAHAAPGTRRRVDRPPARPRRASGPAVGRAQPAVDRQAATLGMRLLLGVRSLPDHSLLDRIVRGRVWIPVLGVLLAGIVFSQVEVLRLNASMGQALRQNSTLAIRNQALRVSVAELSDQTRIERLAARMGMVMPGPTTLSFVPGNPSVTRGLQSIHAPAPDQFVAQLPSPASSDTMGSGGSSSSAAASGSGAGSGSTDTSGSGASSSSGSGASSSSSSSGSSSSGSASGG